MFTSISIMQSLQRTEHQALKQINTLSLFVNVL